MSDDQIYYEGQGGWKLTATYEKAKGGALIVLDKESTQNSVWRIKEISSGSGDYWVSL